MKMDEGKKKRKGKTGFDMVVDVAARRIKKENERVPQDIIYEVSKHYGVNINELAAALGKRKKVKMKVKCDIEYKEKEDDYGRMRECVVVSCSRCGHKETSWGQGEGSVKRCLALMRENCEEGEDNFYVAGEG